MILPSLNLCFIDCITRYNLANEGADVSDSPSLSEEIMSNLERDISSLKEDSAEAEDTSEMSSTSPIIGNDASSSEKS